MIVPWAPAGAVDTTARIIAPKLAERLGKPVIDRKSRRGRFDARHRDRGQGDA